ncbi:MAG: hypothetical protein ABI649_08130 [Gaiellaceae bacterium]
MPVPAPDPQSPDTQIWDGPDGTPAAYFYPADSAYWVQLPGIGSYRVSPEGDVLAVPEDAAPQSLVLDAYRRTVLPQALQFFGHEVLHASAVVTEGGVVGFCAYSKTGKSTLAFALAGRGYRPWADDALLFETTAGEARTLALPFAIRLRPASRDYFRVDPLPVEGSPAANGSVSVGREALPLKALSVLTRAEEGEKERVVERVSPGDAVPSLLPHAYWVSLRDEKRKARMVRAYLDVAGSVPVYRIRVPHDLDQLPALLDEIERVVLERPGAA